jgi:hypothetical protein
MLFILVILAIVAGVFFSAWFNDLAGYERERVYSIVGYTLLSIVLIAFGVCVFIVS